MDEYWDADDQWMDEPRCTVCGFRTQEFVCSATCSDIQSLKESLSV